MSSHRPHTVAEIFAEAMRAYETGHASQARKLARAILDKAPKFGGAHYLLGLISLDQGQARRASEHLATAIAITPGQTILHLAMARALELGGETAEATLHLRMVLSLMPDHAEAHARLAAIMRRTGRRDDAIRHARQAVQVDPAHAEALNILGGLLQEDGRSEEAAAVLKRALDLRPNWGPLLNNYALALQDLGRLDDALAILTGAVDVRPDHAPTRANLAGLHRRRGDFLQAVQQAERAVKLNARCAEAWMELGLARQELHHYAGALAAFERAAVLIPERAQPWFCLGEAARLAGEGKRAESAYRHCLERDPQDRHGAALGLALLGAMPVPDKAPEAYVRQLFDDYAEKFDAALVERLEYRAPSLLAAALERVFAGRPHGLVVLDAGCGTGLAGPVLRPLADKLDGVDLSPAMIAKARTRGLYDELAEGDLIRILSDRPCLYDLIVAADVLVYIGALDAVFSAAHAALKPGGRFAFTVEKDGDGDGSYRLGPKQRYAHTPAYVRRQAEKAGFCVELMEDAVTRCDGGAAVPGLLVVLRLELFT